MASQKTIGARVYHNCHQFIGHETEIPLMFNSERYDTDNIHDCKYGTTKLVCRTPGIYIIVAMCIWLTHSLGMAQLTIKLNGEKILATDRQQGIPLHPPFNHCTTIWKLKKDDYVEAIVYYSSPHKVGVPTVRRAIHWDSPEFMMHLLR